MTFSSITQSLLIVVPTLNSHHLLPRLIDSVQRQTMSNWTLLFVDGPSSHTHRQWLLSLCASESRCRWIEQTSQQPGIFGAMNLGFLHASPNDWILFLGSDDWFSSPDVLAKVMATLESSAYSPDLIICSARYFSASSRTLIRSSSFQSPGTYTASSYRRSMFLGSTPPHQSTLFGPGVRRLLSHYDSSFRLSADLNYFLQVSQFPDLTVQCLDIELVHMSDAGISGQLTFVRLYEVLRAYYRNFGIFCWFPFLARYIRRIVSLPFFN